MRGRTTAVAGRIGGVGLLLPLGSILRSILGSILGSIRGLPLGAVASSGLLALGDDGRELDELGTGERVGESEAWNGGIEFEAAREDTRNLEGSWRGTLMLSRERAEWDIDTSGPSGPTSSDSVSPSLPDMAPGILDLEASMEGYMPGAEGHMGPISRPPTAAPLRDFMYSSCLGLPTHPSLCSVDGRAMPCASFEVGRVRMLIRLQDCTRRALGELTRVPPCAAPCAAP